MNVDIAHFHLNFSPHSLSSTFLAHMGGQEAVQNLVLRFHFVGSLGHPKKRDDAVHGIFEKPSSRDDAGSGIFQNASSLGRCGGVIFSNIRPPILTL